MKSQIEIFETGIKDGIMSKNKKFYKENLTQEEINKIFLETRLKFAKKYNLNGLHIFQALQKTQLNKLNYPDGKYIVISEENMTKEDYWSEELPADILIISNKYKNIIVGNQMSDCPILIAEDRRLGVTALAHCGASYINRNLPIQTIMALENEYHSNLNDIYVYIGSCIKTESYVYDSYPSWATNKEVWKDCIKKEQSLYKIDLVKAIKKQLKSIGISHIKVSKIDTFKDKNYYSHLAEYNGIKEKSGQNFVGFYYK
ncbi:MAG: laccase domain-containing protein [Tenericutes bacterium]|nr:laccase domain-containing protein [Mycoplasmatota bacterium]